MEPGKFNECATCGFLAKRPTPSARVPPPYSYEVSLEERDQGALYAHIPDTLKGSVPTLPGCYKRAADIDREIADRIKESNGSKKEATVWVVQKNRECKSWFPYTEGFSPKEHAEEEQTVQIEQLRQDFTQQLENQRHQSQRFERNITITLAVIAIVFTLMQLFVGVVNLLYPDGWPWLMEWIGPSKTIS